jgi:hypothetical protein
MGLSAWEQQALNSIKSGIAGSDPELAALLSGFSRLASGEEMPDREKVRAGPRWLRRTWQRSSLRRAYQGLGFQRAALLWLWMLTTAALIAAVVVLSTGSDHGSTCAETIAMACAGPAPGHSPGSSSPSTTIGQAPQQPSASIPQAGP